MSVKKIEAKTYLTPEQYAAVKMAAELEDMPMSALMRRAAMSVATEILQRDADAEQAG